MKTTQDMLEDWGRWARGDLITTLGYSRQQLGLGSTIGMPNVPDEVAGRVDYAVAQLRVRDQRQAAVIMAYYIQGLSISQIGRALAMNRHTSSHLLCQAEAYVEGLLHGLDQAG